MPVVLKKRFWTLRGEYAIVRVLSYFNVDRIRRLLALTQSYEVDFNTEGSLGWYPYNFDDSFVSQVVAYDSVNRGGTFTEMEVRVSHWSEYFIKEMRLELAVLTVSCFIKSKDLIYKGFLLWPTSVHL